MGGGDWGKDLLVKGKRQEINRRTNRGKGKRGIYIVERACRGRNIWKGKIERPANKQKYIDKSKRHMERTNRVCTCDICILYYMYIRQRHMTDRERQVHRHSHIGRHTETQMHEGDTQRHTYIYIHVCRDTKAQRERERDRHEAHKHKHSRETEAGTPCMSSYIDRCRNVHFGSCVFVGCLANVFCCFESAMS